jgi:plasmid replication initiation protein
MEKKGKSLISKTVKQSNHLVRVRPKADNQFKISLNKRRILYYVIDQISQKIDHPLGEHWVRVNFNDLTKWLTEGYQTRGYNGPAIWRDLDDFRDKKYHMDITYIDQNGSYRVRQTQWILEIDRPVAASGYIDVHVPNLITENIRDLDAFYTLVPAELLKEATTRSQVKLYELLKSIESKGEWIVSCEEIKGLMEVTGYKRFSDFTKHIIKPSVEFINTAKYSEIHANFDRVKEGNKTTGLHFLITKRVSKDRNLPKKKELLNLYSASMIQRLNKAAFSDIKGIHKEGITEEDLEWAFNLGKTKPKHIRTEARSARDKRLAYEYEAKKIEVEKTIRDQNRLFMIENYKEYDFQYALERIDIEPYFYHEKTKKTFNFNDTEFMEKTECLKWKNLRSKIQISGSGDKRSKIREESKK